MLTRLATGESGCQTHGPVAALHPALEPHPGSLAAVAAGSRVPVWLPWPLPPGWVVTGIRHVGEQAGGGAVAVAVACSGPDPLSPGGAVDLVVMSEQPGIGWGARLAGLAQVDPGTEVAVGVSQAKVHAGTRPAPLWHLPGPPDRAVYVGEADGVWLYLLAWPAAAGALLLADLHLIDLRDPDHALDVPYGSPTDRLGRAAQP